MKEITIEHLAYALNEAKKANQPQAIFFLGAGASRSGNIPLASEIITKILSDYADSPFVKGLPQEERTYAKLMECLKPAQRDELLKRFIAEAKINVTHIYLAQLIKEGFVDYVLTVNFDNLILRALALYNIFPATYDMAILKDLTTTTFKEQSVVYLHGQSHGVWLLNTPEELKKVETTVPRIFDAIKNRRPWVFIGYSGEDPIFKHIKNLGRFDDGLYWVAYNDHDPKPEIQGFLCTPNTNAFLLKGFDSDSFMLKLNTEMGLGQPSIVDKPFTALSEMLEEIVDIDEKDPFKGVKERLSISKRQVADAIKQFELGDGEIKDDIEQNKIDLLKKKVINLLITEKYDAAEIVDLEKDIQALHNKELNILLAGLYTNWGNSIGTKARTKEASEAEVLFEECFDKYQKAIEIKPDNHIAYHNWGTDLVALAKNKLGSDTELLFLQCFDKYQKAIEINPDDYDTYFNWGTSLGILARTKFGQEAEDLFLLSFEKYKKAIDANPNQAGVYYNWGTDLGALANMKKGEVAENLFLQGFKKYQKAIELEPDNHNAYNNWGTDLSTLGKRKVGNEAEVLIMQAITKYQKAIEINPDKHEAYHNWGTILGALARKKGVVEAEELFLQAFSKYHKALDIKPDNHETYHNWGTDLGELARKKVGNEAEELFLQAFSKYQKALDIKPDYHETYFNWGTDLGAMAKTKGGIDMEDLYKQSFEKFSKSLEIEPNYAEAYYNWGTYLGSLAKNKELIEGEELYNQSFEKFQKAIEIKGNIIEAYHNWGSYLGTLAKVKTGDEADYLFNQCFEKYQKAIEIVPKHEVYDNWGSDLIALAKTKEGEEAVEINQQAFKKLSKAVELGGNVYNFACWNALYGSREDALSYLEKSFLKGEVKPQFVGKDDDWGKYKEDEDFIRILNKYGAQQSQS